MDFLFAKDRTPWVFTDKQATKIGAIFDRDFEHGEAFTALMRRRWTVWIILSGWEAIHP
jgi:hypothetical protein